MRAADTPTTPVPEAAPSARVSWNGRPRLARETMRLHRGWIVLFGCVLAVFVRRKSFAWRRLRQNEAIPSQSDRGDAVGVALYGVFVPLRRGYALIQKSLATFQYSAFLFALLLSSFTTDCAF